MAVHVIGSHLFVMVNFKKWGLAVTTNNILYANLA